MVREAVRVASLLGPVQALAESVNGQLKVEYDLDATFENLANAREVVDRIVHQYNYYRPHGRINLRCSEEYHLSFVSIPAIVNPEPEIAHKSSTNSRKRS